MEIKYKNPQNVITVCKNCGQCIDCCENGLVCEGHHLSLSSLFLARFPSATELENEI